MAQNIKLNIKGNDGFDTYHPETNFGQVLNSAGKNLDEVLVDGSTSEKGLVQLTTSTTSTSVTTAATPKSVKDALEAAKSHTETSITELINSGHTFYADDTGTANDKVVTVNPIVTSYKKGLGISFTNLTQNTGAVTLNVNGLGTKPILKSNGSALTSGNLKAGSVYTVRYSGTSFTLQGEGGEYGTAVAGDVLGGKTIGTDGGLVTGTLALTGDVATAQVLSGRTFYDTDPKVKKAGSMTDYSNINVNLAHYDKVKSLIPHPADLGGQGLLTVENANGAKGFFNEGTTFSMNIANLVPANIVKGVPIGRSGGVGSEVMIGTATIESMGGVPAFVAQPGDVVLAESVALVTQSGTAFVKMKEIVVNFDGVIRTKFDFSSSGANAEATIRVNDVAYGATRVVWVTSYTTFTEDFTVRKGDRIQVYGRSQNGGGNPRVQNFKICASTNPNTTIIL